MDNVGAAPAAIGIRPIGASSLSRILRLIRASCPQPFGLTPLAVSKIAPSDFVAI